jgi:hypothetical protein
MSKRLIFIIGNRGILFPAFPLFRRFQYGGDEDWAFILEFDDPAKYGL